MVDDGPSAAAVEHPPDLATQAEAFAGDLTGLLNHTVTTGATVTVFLHEGGEVATVAPGGVQRIKDIELVPLSTAREPAERAAAGLWLKVAYVVALDDEHTHLTVLTSVLGLCVNPNTGNCPIRVEYDRNATAKPPAHLHVHGRSSSLARAYALAGQPPKDMQHLHFPVGGRRFRPTLEDFIEFLKQEKLVKVKPTWKKALAESRGDWEARQTRAAARRHPEAAAAQLVGMGYRVAPPRAKRPSR